MAWLASELSAATAQQRRIVLLLHSHRELGLAVDPAFARMLTNSNVAAIFYGHVHIKPWGMTGNFPNTNVPMFNCGASWWVLAQQDVLLRPLCSKVIVVSGA
jgi:hypothetical protein